MGLGPITDYFAYLWHLFLLLGIPGTTSLFLKGNKGEIDLGERGDKGGMGEVEGEENVVRIMHERRIKEKTKCIFNFISTDKYFQQISFLFQRRRILSYITAQNT